MFEFIVEVSVKLKGKLIRKFTFNEVEFLESAEILDELNLNECDEVKFVIEKTDLPVDIVDIYDAEEYDKIVERLLDVIGRDEDEQYNILNDYYSSYPNDKIYEMGEIDDMLEGETPTGIILKTLNKNFSLDDPYFMLNGYGKLVSLDELKVSEKQDEYLRTYIRNNF